MKTNLKETLTEGIDEPFKSGISLFKRGKVRCVLIFEDGSFSEYWKKLTDAYFMTIKKRKYLIVPKCIIRGKYPTIVWYFNNPSPIFFEFERSKVTALDFRTKDEQKLLTTEQKHLLAKVYLDSEGLDSAFDNSIMKGFYSGGGTTVRRILIIILVVAVLILLILHFTGVINIMELLGVGKK